jgi:hypothetical protein
MEPFCQRCELENCVCEITDMVSFVVGKTSRMFIGIANPNKDNNCFLSVVLQCLLNTESFKDLMLETCIEHPRCAICCLRRVNYLMQLAKSENNEQISISEFRSDLEQICQGQVFQFGSQGDAMETLEILFTAMHNSEKGDFESFDLVQNEDCNIECSAHNLCFNNIIEKISCECKNVNSEYNNLCFSLKINSSWFYSEKKEMVIEQFSEYHYDSQLEEAYLISQLKNYVGTFSKIFKTKYAESSISEKTVKKCGKCQRTVQNKTKLMSEPKMMIFHVSWDDTYNIELLRILQFCISLQGKISLNEMFDEVNSEQEMGLVGLIVFLNNHYVYFTLGEDFFWYKIDDSMCFLVGAGRWYDVILNLLYMKGIIVGLIYEELQATDLSLYRIELLILEKIVYTTILTLNNEVGIMDNLFDQVINPRIQLKPSTKTNCIFCDNEKILGRQCDFCSFDPNHTEWICEKCNFTNSQFTFMCDKCNHRRIDVWKTPRQCITCSTEIMWAICEKCDILFECSICKKKKTPLQSCFCAKCKKSCRDGYCKDDESYNMICLMCK